MLQPKRLKHRRQFRGIYRRVAIKGNQVNFGTHGIKTLESGMITDRQIEACRVVMARATRKAGRFWMRIFPDRPYTKKPPEVTMGAGKGDVSHYVAIVTPGRMLYEIEGLDEASIKVMHKNLTSKLGLKTKVILRQI